MWHSRREHTSPITTLFVRRLLHHDCKIKVFLMLEKEKEIKLKNVFFFSVLTRQVVQASKMMTTLALQHNRCQNEVQFLSSTIVTRLKRRTMIRCRYQRSPLVSCRKKYLKSIQTCDYIKEAPGRHGNLKTPWGPRNLFSVCEQQFRNYICNNNNY